jgi:hypothetical protein
LFQQSFISWLSSILFVLTVSWSILSLSLSVCDYYKICYEKLKRSLGTSRRGWEDKIKMDVKEMVCEVLNWSHLVEYRAQWRVIVKNKVMELQAP